MLLENRKARFHYEVVETLEAGVELRGFEVKSLKRKHGSIGGSYVSVRAGEAFLINMNIPPYQPRNAPTDYDPMRPRKLLLTKQEIVRLSSAEGQNGLTLVPLKVYNKAGMVKVEVAVARGKKLHDKREAIKRRETDRDIARALREL